MASDSQDSLRKHHRSPSDDDSPEKSKRRKHRHHRRRHRRHRHHRSKHDESKTDEIESEMKVDLGIAVNSAGYDDMEEGEIVEEGEINDAKDASDLESGELDDGYMRDAAAMNDVPMVDTDRKSDTILKSLSDSSGDNKKHRSHASVDESPESVSIANGNAVKSLGKSDKRRDKHRRESKEQPVELMEVDEEGRRNSYSLKTKDDRQVARYHSPRDRNRSETPDLKKDRDLHERRSRSRHHHVRDDGIYENGKVYDDLDEGRDSRVHTDYRIDRSERGNDRRRERSSSRHRTSMYENGDPFDMKGRERELLRMKTDKDLDSERERRGRDREKGRESDKDKNRGREARRVVDWDRERERDRDLKRDKDRGRSRDRDYDRERRRDASISSLRDKDLDRERDRRQQSERDRESYRGRDRHDSESERRRQHQYADNGNERGGRDRHHGYGEPEYMAGNRKYDSEKYRASKDEAVKEVEDDKRDDDDQNDYEVRVELKLAEQEEDDVDRIKEESRRRREAILKKYKAKELQQQVPQDAKESVEQVKEQPSQKSSSGNDHQEEGNRIKHDEVAFGVDNSHNVGKSPLTNENVAVKSDTGAGGLGEGSPKSERLSDMFCDDIFGDSPAGIRKTGKGDGLPVERSGLIDNWDDPEGYYSFRFGEILDGRYEVTAAHGKGVFSTVVRAKDLKAGSGDPEEVAIKIIRNNETMLKAGTEELVILKKLVGADPEDRRHCVRYLSNFKYRNHLCIVFESLHMNLREVLKKFGRNIGLKLTAVRTYAKQLFIALKHLRNCGVLHSDIKPDNMLVNEAKNVLKLCDFGNAMFAGKNEITPYLVSRFYRAPEIILGLPYDHPMDIWSIGCCLYEIYTGKVLFPGATNNDMLRLHMELKGPFPKKMLRKGAFVDPHFDQDFNFLAIEEDPVTKKAIRKVIFNIKPKDIGSIIMGSAGEDPKMLANFKDLLDKIFILDPDKRLTVSQALSHPFITGK